MPSNTALWLVAQRGPFELRSAPYPVPLDREIVIKTRAVAINPVDWLFPIIGNFAFPWLKYPFVIGSDAAGEVVEVGTGVTRFKVGDRVLGHAVGADKSRNNPAEGAFQDYTLLLEHMTAPIPDALSYERAAVLPLGLSTAACGLFQNDQLALDHPSATSKPTGKTLLVWGGSTSVGSNAIQLAVAAGYDVITTASPKNFDYVRRLGAVAAFDYKSKTVVRDIIQAFSGRTCAGALAIGVASTAPCVDIVHACKGAKVVSFASPPVSFDDAPQGRGRTVWLVPKIARMLASNVGLMLKTRTRRIRTQFIFGSSLLANEVGPMIYVDFLPQALADGRYVTAPEPVVVGHGLGEIQRGLAAQKQGMSAQKVVVSI
ncbi:zinc-binding alcohol dehydrogenase family protein [Lichenihabitans psoromatis]|uniref:zinc-binding alcohol dehydrogenase family protein n=1 Tax=Lichenihabitans psoromatis TaxID=2528642 RepID=UPI001035A6C4|nr:zinc-binding alcohol dehydrogenase family protein [Lichenihabitans psoromatis]